ncbi:hypothetical protein VTP01DRAFT_6066 [Rhizomucor pusillus]|uniref:uncharacterized protein n=1 Tax=Rhizomucor pusillus TaxID=4840 RepID=UPI0037422AA4
MSQEQRVSSYLQHKGLLNFRDLGISTIDLSTGKSYVKTGLLFRSATLDNLSSEDVDKFIKDHNIHTILDLRTSYEGRCDLPIDKSFPTTALENVKPLDVLSLDKHEQEAEATKDTSGNASLVRKKYRIDFAGRNFQRNCIFTSCSLSVKIMIILLMIFCQRRRAAMLVGERVLTPMGVANMYKRFIDHCQNEIFQAMMIFVDEKNYPVHIHCTQGKDRTGLVSCLLLSIAGVPLEIIVRDYAQTQKGLAPIREKMLQELKEAGLSEEFADAPPQNMRDLLRYIEQTYGSVSKYLDHIGFGEIYQKRVRDIISVSPETKSTN